MGKIKDYQCVPETESSISEDAEQALGIRFPEAHYETDSIVRIALYEKEKKKRDYCALPFCHTIEGEAFGASINLGDAKQGPRAAQPIVQDLEAILQLPDIDFHRGRIKAVLDACEILKAQGEVVLLDVNGPFTILNMLIDSQHIYKALRKNREGMQKIYAKLHRNLMAYITHAVQKGVDVISYADAAASVSIIGPKLTEQLAQDFTVPLLQDIEQQFGQQIIVHLCPKTTRALIGTDNAQYVDVSFEENQTYFQGMMHAKGQHTFLGDRCIALTNRTIPTGQIRAIQLKEK